MIKLTFVDTFRLLARLTALLSWLAALVGAWGLEKGRMHTGAVLPAVGALFARPDA